MKFAASAAAVFFCQQAFAVPVSGVTAVVTNGDLLITGTSGADKVSVTEVGDGVWRVSGAGKTTINGQASVDLEVSGSIRVNLMEGNDSLYIHDGTVPRSLFVSMGDGNDTATVTNLVIGQPVVAGIIGVADVPQVNVLSLSGDAGNDSLYVSGVQVLNSANFTSIQSAIEGSTIAGGDGNDQIIVQNFQAPSLAVTGDSGKDQISLQLLSCGSLTVDGGDDTDKININAVTTGVMKVGAGESNGDVLNVSGCRANVATFFDDGKKGTISGAFNVFGKWFAKGFSLNNLSVYSPSQK